MPNMNVSLESEAQQEHARVRRDLSRTHPKPIRVKRTGITLAPDRARVLVRPFNSIGEQRATKICARVLALPETEVHHLLAQVLSDFGERHQQILRLLK